MATNSLTAQETRVSSATTKLFTPNMVFVATILGGIFGGCALIWANYRALKKTDSANKTILWAIGGFIGLWIVASQLPPTAGFTGISGGLSFGLRMFAAQTFGKDYPKASWWMALLIAVASLVATALVAIAAIIISVMVALLLKGA